MAANIITEKELRIFAMDKPELNTLLSGVRFSSEDIEQAGINVIDYFNILNPPTGNVYTQESFPSRYLLMIGIWGYLLRGASINQASNELNYTAGGISVDDNNKAQLFASLGEKFWEEFKELASQLKLTQNINQAYGTKGSAYRWIAR